MVFRPALRRRAARVLGWSMALTLIVPVLVALAWLASNWRDVPARPQPAALVLPPPRFDDASNRFWALAGVRSAPGTDGAQATRAEWLRMQAWALLTYEDRQRGLEQWVAESERLAAPRGQAGPSGPPWACAGEQAACTDQWIAQAAALAGQRQAASWGATCQSLLDGPFEMEEPIARPSRPASPMAPWTGATACMSWFLSGAALAHANGDREALLTDMARADRLQRAVAQGAHTLVGQAIAMRMAGRMADTAVHFSLRDATLAAPLAPLLVGWMPPRQRIGRWVAHEAHAQRGAIDDLLIGCVMPFGVSWPDKLVAEAPWPERLNDDIDRWMCRHRIGLQPELTAQASERSWLALLARIDAGWPAVVALQSPALPAWSWRNTTGTVLLAAVGPVWDDYLKQQADFELHQRIAALALAMQREGVAKGDRAAWLARQVLLPHERERITVEEGGRTIAARGWTPNRLRTNLPRYTWPN